MSRNLSNWIESYLQWTENTESPEIFHKWTAISLIAAVLRRKVWFSLGRLKIHPNCYIVFVATPGTARKTQALNFGEEILTCVSGITLGADVTTIQALLDDLQDSVTAHLLPTGDNLAHASLTVVSGEFESFLGCKKDNAKMIVTLTDLFDCKIKPFRTRTRHAGSNEIPHPFLNIVAATTPDSLANSLPTTAIGGGLTSRMIFVWADRKRKKVDVPEEPPQELKEMLCQDLAVISRISGEYKFSPEGRKWWAVFYDAFEENDPKRICKDPAFSAWYSRKPMYVLKVAISLTASCSNEQLLHADKLALSLQYIEEAEHTMKKTFSAVGRSTVTADVDMVRNIIESHKTISENALLQMVWRDIDSKKFDTVIYTILRSGEITRTFKGPKGERGIFYNWVEKV